MQETDGRMCVVDMDGCTMLIVRSSRMAASERDIVMLTSVTGCDCHGRRVRHCKLNRHPL